MGGKKKKTSGKSTEDVVIPVKKTPIIRENWIMIHFKLLNWKFMNFSMKFRENTHIFTIKKILQERHGRIDELKLCFHSFIETNEINDEMLTLKECGLKGAPEPEAMIEYNNHQDKDESKLDATSTTTNNITNEIKDHIDSISITNDISRDNNAMIQTIPSYQLFYDFKPTNYSDPVILYFP